jgi:hypothetical protein
VVPGQRRGGGEQRAADAAADQAGLDEQNALSSAASLSRAARIWKSGIASLYSSLRQMAGWPPVFALRATP